MARATLYSPLSGLKGCEVSGSIPFPSIAPAHWVPAVRSSGVQTIIDAIESYRRLFSFKIRLEGPGVPPKMLDLLDMDATDAIADNLRTWSIPLKTRVKAVWRTIELKSNPAFASLVFPPVRGRPLPRPLATITYFGPHGNEEHVAVGNLPCTYIAVPIDFKHPQNVAKPYKGQNKDVWTESHRRVHTDPMRRPKRPMDLESLSREVSDSHSFLSLWADEMLSVAWTFTTVNVVQRRSPTSTLPSFESESTLSSSIRLPRSLCRSQVIVFKSDYDGNPCAILCTAMPKSIWEKAFTAVMHLFSQFTEWRDTEVEALIKFIAIHFSQYVRYSTNVSFLRLGERCLTATSSTTPNEWKISLTTRSRG